MEAATATPDAPETSAEKRHRISADITVPSRSRTFTPDDVTETLALLKGEHESQRGDDDEPGEPAKNVGFGEFDSKGAARSAGNTLNRLLEEAGAEHKYAVTTFERGGKIVGVLLNKPAKKVERKTEPAARKRGNR